MFKTFMLPLILSLLVACGGYNQFDVATAPYAQSPMLSRDASVATNVLITLGYDIAHASRKSVETEWETFWLSRGTTYEKEILTRIKVDLEAGMIHAQCMSRYVQGSWYYKGCTNPIVLKRLQFAAAELQSRLPVLAKSK